MEEKNVNSNGSKIPELCNEEFEPNNLGCVGNDTSMQPEEPCGCCSPAPKYLGVKIVGAIPCFGRNNKCVQINNEHDGSEKEGYQVFYEDGYVSWSPKDVFEKAYRPINGLTFGLAIEALKMGKKVARTGWNGKGMWLLFIDETRNGNFGSDGGGSPYYFSDRLPEYMTLLPWIGMKTADNKFVPWLASQTEMLAEDWMIIE